MWTAAFVVVGLWSAPGAQLTMSYCTADTVRCTHFVILSALWDANAALSRVLHFCPRSPPAKLQQWESQLHYTNMHNTQLMKLPTMAALINL